MNKLFTLSILCSLFAAQAMRGMDDEQSIKKNKGPSAASLLRAKKQHLEKCLAEEIQNHEENILTQAANYYFTLDYVLDFYNKLQSPAIISDEDIKRMETGSERFLTESLAVLEKYPNLENIVYKKNKLLFFQERIKQLIDEKPRYTEAFEIFMDALKSSVIQWVQYCESELNNTNESRLFNVNKMITLLEQCIEQYESHKILSKFEKDDNEIIDLFINKLREVRILLISIRNNLEFLVNRMVSETSMDIIMNDNF